MNHNRAIGVVLVAALSGSLLMGCTSDNATTATSTTAAADPLVGTWVAQYPDRTIDAIELKADGEWSGVFSNDRGTYEVTGDTITWLGGNCHEGWKGIYTYTLEDGQFTQKVKDDPCGPRKNAFDGVTYKKVERETNSPSPDAS